MHSLDSPQVLSLNAIVVFSYCSLTTIYKPGRGASLGANTADTLTLESQLLEL